MTARLNQRMHSHLMKGVSTLSTFSVEKAVDNWSETSLASDNRAFCTPFVRDASVRARHVLASTTSD